MDKPKTSETYSRSEKSLSTLTKKFVEMLQADTILDLNVACSAMDVSKKRRIYDITNVLEGINLIRKVGKNLYSWTGKREETDSIEQEELFELKEETKRLDEEEQKLNEAILAMRRNVASTQHSKSFCYLTKNDFRKAFGKNNTVLVIKQFKNIKFNFERDSVLASRKTSTEFRDILVTGDVLRPIQVKAVNMEANSESNLLFCLDDMEEDGDEDKSKKQESIENKPKKMQRKYAARSQNLPLFRRRQRLKSFLELEQHEREKLATDVLDYDKYKDKSIFQFVQEKQLVSSTDYEEPDFVSIEPPTDTEYEENYSIEAPSVHDLFDLDADYLEYELGDYEMIEDYIEEDEDL